jgi:glycosyltransferase involved in cell wall biosynthesis
MKKIRVLVVGQTPPPYHGQAIMIEKLIQAAFDSIEIVPLRMSFSKSNEEVGKFLWKKIFHLFRLLFQGAYQLLFQRIDVLYYPPAGPHLVPILRDIFLLSFWRIVAPNRIFHFRAGGISEFVKSKPGWFRACAHLAYGKPRVAILLSGWNPKDGEYFHAEQTIVIPNGLEDVFDPTLINRKPSEIKLFYIGLLQEEKGIFTLLEAFYIVSALNPNVTLHLAGEFSIGKEKENFFSRAQELGIQDKIIWHGLATLDKKWRLFAQMDLLCFLTHYPAETFGNSVLEAMIWELPVVATRWRGVQDLVLEEQTGFLVSIHDSKDAADKMSLLIGDPELRARYGRNARERFLQEFTLEKHLKRMEKAILSAAASARSVSVESISNEH